MLPNSVELADTAAEWSGAYVHVPFCGRICPYCDFNVVEGREELHPRYVAAVEAQIRNEPPWRRLDAVAFGGGTPSRLSAENLGRILSVLSGHFGTAEGAEVSLEANPEDWTGSTARSLVEQGFNRVSFGAQSFDTSVRGKYDGSWQGSLADLERFPLNG